MNDGFEERLRHALCAGHEVIPTDDDRWVVRTPLLHGDGDALPAVVVRREDAWGISDLGMTVSHLFFDEFEFTEARMKRLTDLAASFGARMSSEHEIFLPLDAEPSAVDIGDFLQLIAQVEGAARTSSSERDQTRYVVSIRDRIVRRLEHPGFEPNWSPPAPNLKTKANYKADLFISETADGSPGVVLFAASTSDKANVAALTMNFFQKANVDVRPVLTYHPDRVASEAVYRFLDEVEDEAAAVPTTGEDLSQVYGALRRRGVALAS